MANQEAALAKFEGIDFSISDRPEQKLDVSVFPLDSAAVISQCVLYGGSLVMAGPNTGKSQLLTEVGQIASNALRMATHSVDINQQVMSVEQLEYTVADLRDFAATRSSGVVLVDHVDALWDQGDNITINAAKRQVRTTLFAKDFEPIVVATTQGRQPEISAEFTTEQQYAFTGSIDVIAAQTMLEHGVPNIDAAATVEQLIKEDALTYANVRYIIRGQNDTLSAEAEKLKETPSQTPELSQKDLQALRTGVKLSTLIVKRHSVDIARQFIVL
jgi:hypothetical protein